MTQQAHTALFTYPIKAAFGRILPKAKIYEYGAVGARLKGLFTEQVEQITWQYKLGPETINLPASPGVPEIQVFGMQLRTPELHKDVLSCIDKAIPFPILFELHFDSRIQVAACYKRPSEAEADHWVCSNYFATDWVPAETPRTTMPIALQMAGLYEQFLHQLAALSARPLEPLGDFVERASKRQAVQCEMERVALRLEKEKQFNRKVEINAQLRQMTDDFEALSK